MRRVIHRETVIGLHQVICGYGHWLPNDVRGSGSEEVRIEAIGELGPVHLGRKRKQPALDELRQFHGEAEHRLTHPVLWFQEAERAVLGEALAAVVAQKGYTVWACAVLRNHVHLCVRVHRDDYRVMREALTVGMRDALRSRRPEWAVHPIWSERPYAVYLNSSEDVRRVVAYIEGNPGKHGLAPQVWGFVKAYDGFPFHKRGRGSR